MVILECPACDAPLPVDVPVAETLHCEGCSVSWAVVDDVSAPACIAAIAA